MNDIVKIERIQILYDEIIEFVKSRSLARPEDIETEASCLAEAAIESEIEALGIAEDMTHQYKG